MNAVIDVHKIIPAWQALQSAAALAHIENEADYEQATALLNSLLDAVRDGAGHPLWVKIFWNDNKSIGYSDKPSLDRAFYATYGFMTLIRPE